jgi:dipeptidyl aminopeptidase/acylaminoacyl peptidase
MSEVLTRLGPALSDRYRIEREIGAGGMATVYLAHDLKHDRDVALKVLRPELAAVLGAERFLNEIRISARLDHPHILTLIDSGEASGFLYYVMPFVRGESLRARIDREKQLGVDEALAITGQVGSALEYAHRHGVVHRDIKPENILIHEGEATLADFGIAMAVKEAGGNRLTETGLSLGTPQYMSPEQATGDRTLDARSDVYSLAAVLYEMLAGEPPHSGATVQAIIAKLMTERPTRLRVMRDTVPEGIDNAVAKALSKVPADRYADAGQFARALASTPMDASRPARRRWLPFAAGGVVLAAAAGLAFVALRAKEKTSMATPERIQLTNTGNASVPAVSPDGNRFAFAEKSCDANGECTYRLVVQDMDGTGRLVLTSGIGSVWSTKWTRDGRYLVYSGSYGSARWGTFAVSTLGGAPRRLGCCNGAVLAGDTVLVSPQVSPGDTMVWLRLVTIADGQPKDSIPVRELGAGGVFAGATDDPQKFALFVFLDGLRGAEIRLIDRSGNVLSRTREGLDLRGRAAVGGRLPGQSTIVVGVQQERAARLYDFFLLRVAGDRIVTGTDTVMRGIELTGSVVDVSPDAGRMFLQSGPYESSVFSFEASGAGPVKVNEVLSSTSTLWGRVSPDGKRIAIIRQVLTDGKPRDQLWIVPFAGGDPVAVSAPVDELNDFEWNRDGSGFLYVQRVSDTERKVVAIDTTGSKVSDILRARVEILSGVQVLPDNRFIIVDPDGRRIQLTRRDGKSVSVWSIPRWMGEVTRYASSPDSRHMAAMGWDNPFDSIVVSKIDVSSGAFTRLASLSGEGFGRVAWTDGGNILFDITESSGNTALYSVQPDGSGLKRVRTLPRLRARYSISSDGKHFAGYSENDKSDIYVIRNLGEIVKH